MLVKLEDEEAVKAGERNFFFFGEAQSIKHHPLPYSIRAITTRSLQMASKRLEGPLRTSLRASIADEKCRHRTKVRRYY